MCNACLDRLVQGGRGRLEPIQERVIPIQQRRQPQQQQQLLQQPDDTTTDIQRHYAMYRRRASNVEPSLSSSSSLMLADDDLSSGFCVSVGRHSRGFSVSLRPQRQQQQQQLQLLQQRASPSVPTERPLLSVVIPASPADASSSLRQRLPGNSDQQQPISAAEPGKYTIYQPLLATGRAAAASQRFYDLPRRQSLLTTSPSGLSCLSVCPSLSVCFYVCLFVRVCYKRGLHPTQRSERKQRKKRKKRNERNSRMERKLQPLGSELSSFQLNSSF